MALEAKRESPDRVGHLDSWLRSMLRDPAQWANGANDSASGGVPEKAHAHPDWETFAQSIVDAAVVTRGPHASNVLEQLLSPPRLPPEDSEPTLGAMPHLAPPLGVSARRDRVRERSLVFGLSLGVSGHLFDSAGMPRLLRTRPCPRVLTGRRPRRRGRPSALGGVATRRGVGTRPDGPRRGGRSLRWKRCFPIGFTPRRRCEGRDRARCDHGPNESFACLG